MSCGATLKTAVVGAGLFGQVHLRGYTENRHTDLVMVCDINKKNLTQAKKTYGVKRVTTDYMDIAKNPEIDAVSVATPDFLHREIVCALLKAGKHVLCEKPLATNLPDATAMVKAARAGGKELMIDFHNRFNPPFVEAKKRIDSGEFGDPVMGSGRQANPLYVPTKMLSWAAKSGPQWFLFPHLIDIVSWLLGRQALKVTAAGRKKILKKMGINCYDYVQALLEYRDCSAIVETSWVIPDTLPNFVDFQVTVFGSKERIGIKPLGPLMEVSGPKKFEQPIVGPIVQAHGVQMGWMYNPLCHFVNSLVAGKSPMCGPDEGWHNSAVICAIEKSITTKKTQKVETL